MDGPKQRWTLECGPSGGSHPTAVAACRRLNSASEPFKPIARDAVCTAIYGGPDVAVVAGTFRGRRVWARFRLADGCQIARWKRLVPLLPSPGA